MRVARFSILALSLLASFPVLASEGRKVTHRAEPTYPEIARRMHMTGKVEVEVTVDPKGNVTDAKVLSGNSMLGSAALSAAKAYKYEPGEESTSRLTFEFH
jgi:TonB family protein